MKPEKRNIALCIVFSIITCGIYGLYWLVKLNDEINMVSDHTGDTSGGIVLLFAIITCGIYTMYWSYRIGIKLDEAVVKRGLPAQNRSIVYLLLTIFGLGVVTYALAQSTLNDIAG